MRDNVFKTIEGRILLAGIIMGVMLAGLVCVYGVTDFDKARTLLLAFIAHTIGGRAAGIGLCIMQGFSAIPTIAYNFYLEVMIVCVTYAIFALSATQYLRLEWVLRIMGNIAITALKNKNKIERFGWAGIFVFVMTPLPVTGPVVGSIIGYMLRMNRVTNFSATLSGTLTAIVIWYVFFDFLEQRFHMIQYVFAGIIFLVVVANLKKIQRFVFAITRKQRPKR